MEILQEVPSHITISCLKDKWNKIDNNAFGAFTGRVRKPEFKLETGVLQNKQAVDLVRMRLQDWQGKQPERGELWPFDEGSLIHFNGENAPSPRELIRSCEAAYDEWAANENDDWIVLDEAPGHKPDLPVLFCREWNRQLDVIRRDPNCIPVNLQEARLYQGVYEALKLAQIAGREMGGIRVQNLSDGVLPPVGKVKRPSVKVNLAAVSGYLTAVVAVTKLENAFKFSPYFNALKKIAAPPVAGSLLIHHQSRHPDGRQGPPSDHR